MGFFKDKFDQTFKSPKKSSGLTRQPSMVQAKTTEFFDQTTAHGWNKIFGSETTKFARIFWSLVLVVSLFGLVIMIYTRITAFINDSDEISFATSISPGDNNSLDLPSISVCSEGFNTEFINDDLHLLILERLDYYFEHQEEIFSLTMSWSNNYMYHKKYNFSPLYS